MNMNNDIDWQNGRITDDGIEFMRSQIGVKKHCVPWNRVVSKESIQHFALGIGDDNPLWWDEDYARNTPWKGLVAPPCYLYSHTNGVRLKPEDGQQSTSLYLPGVLGLWAGEHWKWIRPVHPGETIVGEVALVDVNVNENGKFGGRSVTQTELIELKTEDDEVIAQTEHIIKRFERQEALTRSSYLDRPLATYTEEDRQHIQEHYENEHKFRRGAKPRYIEDILIGEKIGPMLKGPLTINNIIGYMLGWGSSLNATNRMFYSQLKLHPGTKMINPETGIVDNYESPHWEPIFARMSGLPGGYDFGCQRCSWFSHFLTDYAGDDGFLTELDFRLRKPNILNDITWINGTVTEIDKEASIVSIGIEARNQLDELTASAIGRVRLPSKS